MTSTQHPMVAKFYDEHTEISNGNEPRTLEAAETMTKDWWDDFEDVVVHVPWTSIRAGHLGDISYLPDIERRALARYDDETREAFLRWICDHDELAEGVANDSLFVAVNYHVFERIGFILCRTIVTKGWGYWLPERHGHIEELDVLPEYGQKGIGTKLLQRAEKWARDSNDPYITLTTMRSVPWNCPWYERQGWEIVPPGDLPPHLTEVVEEELQRGLPGGNGERIVMVKRL